MKTSLDEVKEIIEGIIRLQDKIMREEPWLVEEAKESEGNIAQIEIYNVLGTYRERLKLQGMKIVKTTEEPIHLIRCSLDVFLDLLLGEQDFGDAYANGLIEFRGENFQVHALKWAKAFKRIRKHIKI